MSVNVSAMTPAQQLELMKQLQRQMAGKPAGLVGPAGVTMLRNLEDITRFQASNATNWKAPIAALAGVPLDMTERGEPRDVFAAALYPVVNNKIGAMNCIMVHTAPLTLPVTVEYVNYGEFVTNLHAVVDVANQDPATVMLKGHASFYQHAAHVTIVGIDVSGKIVPATTHNGDSYLFALMSSLRAWPLACLTGMVYDRASFTAGLKEKLDVANAFNMTLIVDDDAEHSATAFANALGEQPMVIWIDKTGVTSVSGNRTRGKASMLVAEHPAAYMLYLAQQGVQKSIETKSSSDTVISRFMNQAETVDNVMNHLKVLYAQLKLPVPETPVVWADKSEAARNNRHGAAIAIMHTVEDSLTRTFAETDAEKTGVANLIKNTSTAFVNAFNAPSYSKAINALKAMNDFVTSALKTRANIKQTASISGVTKPRPGPAPTPGQMPPPTTTLREMVEARKRARAVAETD